MKKLIPIALCALTTSCIKLEAPPVPPTWNGCEADEQDYIDMAFETRDQPPAIDPGTSAQQVHLDVLEWIASMGYDIIIGKPPGYQGLVGENKDFCAITLPGHIYVSKKCSDGMDGNDIAWSILLRHEGTHAAQQKRMGATFFLIYGYGEGRLLGLETPAYDVTHSTTRHFVAEAGEDSGARAPNDEELFMMAGNIYTKYDGAHIPKECFQEIAVRVWRE